MEESFSTEVFITYLVLACLNYGFSPFLQCSLGYHRSLHSFIFDITSCLIYTLSFVNSGNKLLMCELILNIVFICAACSSACGLAYLCSCVSCTRACACLSVSSVFLIIGLAILEKQKWELISVKSQNLKENKNKNSTPKGRVHFLSNTSVVFIFV